MTTATVDEAAKTGPTRRTTVTAGMKQCRGECKRIKPLDQFYNSSKGTGKRPYCRKCDHKRQYESRVRTRVRTVRQPAYHRALAAMKDLVPAGTWDRVYAEQLARADAEIEQIGDVTLMPGQRMVGETVADRIAEVCTDCGDHHRGGHACAVCGSKPGEPANVIEVAKLCFGQARVSSRTITVIKP